VFKIDLDNPIVKYFINAAFIIYLVILVWVLFIGFGNVERSTHFENPNDHFLPMESTFTMLRNARFYDFRGRPMFLLILNIIGNLGLLAPWGILAPLVFTKLNSIKKIALSAFLISFSAETIQFIFSIGIFDIDDLIFNTVGAVVGFITLQVSQKYLNFSDQVSSCHLS